MYDIYLEQQVDWNQGTSDYNENSENNITCFFRVWSALVDSPNQERLYANQNESNGYITT